MTEEIRPICLYVETCLDRKEGTRDCAKCEHHLNYWTEVMIRDMEKNIIRLEQENKELKEYSQRMENQRENYYKEYNKYRSALEKIQKVIKSYDLTVDNGASVDTLYTIRKIINEVLNDI